MSLRLTPLPLLTPLLAVRGTRGRVCGQICSQSALQQLPVVLVEQGAQGAELWSRRQHQQQQSLLMELEQRLHQHRGLLLTGGAGTGKTTRVRELLADERERHTLLLAPTGKAAARLREALSPLPASMRCSTLQREVPCGGDQASVTDDWSRAVTRSCCTAVSGVRCRSYPRVSHAPLAPA